MHFEYHRSVKQEFESSRLWGGVIISGLIAIFFYVYIKTENEIILFFMLPIFSIVVLFHLIHLRKLSKASGLWEIYITDAEVVWRTPQGFENSFVISISEISKYIESSTCRSEYTTHYLELKSGARIALAPNVNNFNFAAFSSALVKLGVKREALIEN